MQSSGIEKGVIGLSTDRAGGCEVRAPWLPPPPNKRKPGGSSILPKESNFQVIREVFDLKRFYCPAPWKAAQPAPRKTPLPQSHVLGECSPVGSCRLWGRHLGRSQWSWTHGIHAGQPLAGTESWPGFLGRPHTLSAPGHWGCLAEEKAGNRASNSPEG